MKKGQFLLSCGTIIRLNIKRLFSNASYIFGVLLLVLISSMLLLYQEKNNNLSGASRKDAVEWSLKQTDPLEALSDLREKSLNFYQYTPLFSEHMGEEILIIDEVYQYFEDCQEYGTWLEDMIENAQVGVSFAMQSYSMRLQNLLTARQYEKLRGLSVQAGNYTAWEKFFQPGIAEAVLVLLILYTVYHISIVEREKGMNALVHASVGGGHAYFACKTISAVLVMSLLFLLVTGSKLLVYLGLYGSSSLSNPIQGLSGYLGSPFLLSVGEYILLYLLYQYLFNILLVIMISAIGAFALSEFAICILLAVLGVGSLVLNSSIRDYSVWHTVKDISLLSLQNTGYWFSHMHFLYIGSSGSQDIYLQNLQLPVMMFLIYGIASYLTGSYLYAGGLKVSTVKTDMLSRLWNYRKTIVLNEMQYILLQKKTWIAGLAVILLFCMFTDYKPVENDMLRYEKSIRQNLNQMEYDEAVTWLTQKKEEYQNLHEQENELLNKYMEEAISAESYQMAVIEIQRQLVTEPVVDMFAKQTQYLVNAREITGNDIPFAYNTLLEQLYGKEGEYERLLCAVLVAFFIILAVLPVMPADKQCRFSFLIGTASGARKAVRTRILWMVCLVFAVSLAIQFIWLYSLGARYEWLGWNLPMQSWERYASIKVNFTLGTAICINTFIYCLGWAVFAGFLAGLTLFAHSAVWMEILGICFLTGPLMLNLLDVGWVKNILYMRWMVFGQNDLFLNRLSVGSIVMLICLLCIVVKQGWERWIS